MGSIHYLGERLVALFLLAVLLLNPPLLTIFDSSATVWQIPTLYVYLFAVWGLLIILLALVTELTPPGADSEQPPTDEGLQSPASSNSDGG